MPELFIYARGAGSNLTMNSPVNGVGTVNLNAEGSIQVNGSETVDTFLAFVGVDFLDGGGHVVAKNINITAGNNINFTAKDFAVGPGVNPVVFLDAVGTVTLDIRNDQSVLNTAALVAVSGKTISVTPDSVGTTLTFRDGAPIQFTAGVGGISAAMATFISPSGNLTFTSQGGITAASIIGGDDIRSTAGDITLTGDFLANTIFAHGQVKGANVTGITSITTETGPVMAAGTLSSPSVSAGTTVAAGADVNADHVQVLSLTTQGLVTRGNLIAAAGGITPFSTTPNVLHHFTVNTVQSPNGIDFSGGNFALPSSNGGQLQIDATSQIFGSGGISGANFDGANAPMPGMSPAGGGGTLTVNAPGDVSVVNTTISATSGIIGVNDPPSGAGGNVNLTSTDGQVSLNNSIIRVSSSDAAGTPNRRSSASGGNIALRSDLDTGMAIQITSSSQLLSLLENAAPPRQGGLITILATGSSSNVSVSGKIQADGAGPNPRGIDIRHSGDSGQIDADPTNTLMADIIKIATLGDNSTLNINGGGSITAVTLLRLYAGSISASNNSTINFNASVNLSGAQIDIAAHTVNIFGATTMINTSSQAHVYTIVANYQGSGGTGGPTTGRFVGMGAMTQNLLIAPALGPPGDPTNLPPQAKSPPPHFQPDRNERTTTMPGRRP